MLPPTKDTTILITAAEDLAEVDEVLVVHPRPLPRRPAQPTATAASSSLRLRLMFLIGVASLALICIVLISQQLILRHMQSAAGAGNAAVVGSSPATTHLVLEVSLPDPAMSPSGQTDIFKHFNSEDMTETEIVGLDDYSSENDYSSLENDYSRAQENYPNSQDDYPNSLDIDLAGLTPSFARSEDRRMEELSSLEGTRNGLDLLSGQVVEDGSDDEAYQRLISLV